MQRVQKMITHYLSPVRHRLSMFSCRALQFYCPHVLTFCCCSFRASCSVCNSWRDFSNVETILCDWKTKATNNKWISSFGEDGSGSVVSSVLTFWKSSETCWMTDCSSWHRPSSSPTFLSASSLSSSSSSLHGANKCSLNYSVMSQNKSQSHNKSKLTSRTSN